MKFSIRDLFLVTLIVAIVLGWWLDSGRLAKMHDSKQLRLDSDAQLQTEKNLRLIMVDLAKDNEWEVRQFEPAQKPPTASSPAPNPPNP